MKADYLAWQQEVNAAYFNYTQGRANEYREAAVDIAAETAAYAANAADRTAQEVKDLATQEKQFATKLAERVQKYRAELAKLEQSHDLQLADWRRDHPGEWFSETSWDAQRTAKESAYQSDVLALERDRRTQLAQIGLDFTQDLKQLADAAAGNIAGEQAGFDAVVADFYYDSSASGSGLEHTLATLAETYDTNYAQTFADALDDVAANNGSAVWAPWATFSAADAEAHLENLDQPLAEVVFDNRLLLADADNDYNLALGSAGRTRWLAQFDAQSEQALASALGTLATAGLGGDSSLVAIPSPLTAPSVELGWLSGNTPYYASAWNSPLGLSWYGSYDYGFGWHGAGGLFGGNLFGYGFGNGFYDTGYWGIGEWGGSAFYLSGSDYGGWWGNWSYDWSYAGFAAPVFNSYDSFGAFGSYYSSWGWDIGGTGVYTGSYGNWYNPVFGSGGLFGGNLFGYGFGHYGGWGYSPYAYGWGGWSPSYFNDPGTPALVDPTVEVAKMESTVDSAHTPTTTVVTTLETEKSSGPAAIDALHGVLKLAGKIGFTALAVAVVGVTGTPTTEVVSNRIEKASGRNWSGKGIEEVFQILAPNSLGFFQTHFRLQLTSGGSDELVVSIRHGTSGKAVNGINAKGDVYKDYKDVVITLEIPTGWNDLQIFEKIRQEIVSPKSNISALFELWTWSLPERATSATNRSADLRATIRAEWFPEWIGNGLKEAAEYAELYIKTIASLAPGGGAAVAYYELDQGNYSSAAWEVIFLIPPGKVGELAGKFLGLTVKAGEKVFAHIPKELLERIAKLTAKDKQVIISELRAAKSNEEALAKLEKFLKEKKQIVGIEDIEGTKLFKIAEEVAPSLKSILVDYWQFSGGVALEEAEQLVKANGFAFEIGVQSRFENARNAVVISKRDLKAGLVNRIELAEEIQHGLDWATFEKTRAGRRGLSNPEFHVELFQRVLSGYNQGKFPFLTAGDVKGIEQIMKKLKFMK